MADFGMRGHLTTSEWQVLDDLNAHLRRFHGPNPTLKCPCIRYVWSDAQKKWSSPWWQVIEREQIIACFYDLALAARFARDRAVLGARFDFVISDEHGLDYKGDPVQGMS